MSDVAKKMKLPLVGGLFFPKLAEYWQTGYGCDCTIQCDDGSMSVPAVLLANLSDTLNCLIAVSNDNAIRFKNISIDFWHELFKVIYTGEIKQIDCGSDSNFINNLLIAYGLKLFDVVYLYKHLLFVDNNNEVFDFFKQTLVLEEDLVIEITTNDGDFKSEVIIKNDCLSNLREVFQHSFADVESQCKTPLEDTMQQYCVNCEPDICEESEIVQCCLCGENISKDRSSLHVMEKHSSPRAQWPYTCKAQPEYRMLIVGRKVKQNEYTSTKISYECTVCNVVCTNLFVFLDHYLSHGYVPEMCYLCGDVLAKKSDLMKHLQFCLDCKGEENPLIAIENVKQEVDMVLETKDEDEALCQQELIEETEDYSGVHTSNACQTSTQQMHGALSVCTEVSKLVDTTGTLAVHINMQPYPSTCIACFDSCEAKQVLCLYCGEVVSKDETHMVSAHSDSQHAKMWVYSCYIEDDKSKVPEFLVEYKRDSEYYECKLCLDLVATLPMIDLHLRAVHKILSVYHCKNCHAGFRNKSTMETHERLCSGQMYLKCNECDVLFADVDTLEQHKNTQHAFAQVLGKNEPVCLNCRSNCQSEQVWCCYCFNKIDSIEFHFQQCHSYCSDSSNLVYTCDRESLLLSTTEKALLSIKHSIDTNMEQSGENIIQYVYTCTLCEDSFAKIKLLKSHILEIHGFNVKICSTCYSGFSEAAFLQSHLYYCNGNLPILCLQCDNFVGNSDDFESHVRSVHKENFDNSEENSKLETDNENEKKGETIVSSDNSLEQLKDPSQIKSENNNGEIPQLALECVKSIKCGICEVNGKDCQSMHVWCGLCKNLCERDITHMSQCHPCSPSKTWIVFCKQHLTAAAKEEYLLSDRVAAVHHLPRDIAVELLKPDYYYKCNSCCTVFSSLPLLEDHVQFAHPGSKNYYVCAYCEILIGNKSFYENHVQFCNLGSIFNCFSCDRKFVNMRAFKDHKCTNENNSLLARKTLKNLIAKGTILKCPESDCQYESTILNELKSHCNDVHNYKKHQLGNVCKVCHKVFRDPDKKENHYRLEHMNGEKHLCDTCGKEFDTMMRLRRHVNYYHNGERERTSLKVKYFKQRQCCPHCGVVYSNVCNLNKHIRVVHENVRYICKVCKKYYRCTSSLKAHEAKHSGEMKYECPHCPYRAYKGNYVNLHIAKHHPGKDKAYKRNKVFK